MGVLYFSVRNLPPFHKGISKWNRGSNNYPKRKKNFQTSVYKGDAFTKQQGQQPNHFFLIVHISNNLFVSENSLTFFNNLTSHCSFFHVAVVEIT